jgi:hypothetical protein
MADSKKYIEHKNLINYNYNRYILDELDIKGYSENVIPDINIVCKYDSIFKDIYTYVMCKTSVMSYYILNDINWSWSDIKKLMDYVISGVIKETVDENVLTLCILIEIEKNVFITLDEINNIINKINNVKSNEHRKELIYSLSVSMWGSYNMTTDTECKWTILHYMKKFTAEGCTDALLLYSKIGECLNLTKHDIINYIINGGHVNSISIELTKLLGISHSPELFELAFKNANLFDDNNEYYTEREYNIVNNYHKQACITRFLNHTDNTPSFETKLLLNNYKLSHNYCYNIIYISKIVNYTKPKYYKSIKKFKKEACVSCNGSNCYNDEISYYYNNLNNTICTSSDIYTLDIIQIISSYLRYK